MIKRWRYLHEERWTLPLPSAEQGLFYTTRSATSPSFAYVSNSAPDSSLCEAAAPRLRLLQLLLPARLPLDPLQLLLPVCIRFSCCSPLAFASAAARHLHPLQLLLPYCVRFNCSSPIADCCSPPLFPAHAQCSQTFFVEFEVQ